MSNTKIRQRITEQVVAALEKNLLPWRRPWSLSRNAGRAANVASKRAYSGINPLILELHRVGHGLGSRWYGTFDQWRSLGCTVRKRPDHVEPGHWGGRIVFFKPVTKTRVNKESKEAEEDRFFLLRTYTVFNADQVEGADRWQTGNDESTPSAPDFGPAEELIAATNADIRHQGDRAFYDQLPTFL